MPVSAIGSRGGDFTYQSFRGVTKQKVTNIHLDGVGDCVAEETPRPLAERLLELFAARDDMEQVEP